MYLKRITRICTPVGLTAAWPIAAIAQRSLSKNQGVTFAQPAQSRLWREVPSTDSRVSDHHRFQVPITGHSVFDNG